MNKTFKTLLILCLLVASVNSCTKDKKDNSSLIKYGPTAKDIDGNIYRTVTIGSQIWMVENLNVSHYRNGDSLTNITDNDVWMMLSTGAYCVYDDSSANNAIYGKLYNWFTVNDSRNIAPVGWHIPTDDEWSTLIEYLGGYSVAGAKLREAGTTHWELPNLGATNETGFTALPGGFCDLRFGGFFEKGSSGFWWTKSEFDNTYAWYRNLRFGEIAAHPGNTNDKRMGLSIRCIKD